MKPDHESIWGTLVLIASILMVFVGLINDSIPLTIGALGFALLGQLFRMHQMLHCLNWELTEQRRYMAGNDLETKSK
jgi:hypothetical protein